MNNKDFQRIKKMAAQAKVAKEEEARREAEAKRKAEKQAYELNRNKILEILEEICVNDEPAEFVTECYDWCESFAYIKKSPEKEAIYKFVPEFTQFENRSLVGQITIFADLESAADFVIRRYNEEKMREE